MDIKFAKSREEIDNCFPVMIQLRPNIKTEDEFAEQIKRQKENGYNFVFLEDDSSVKAVAGFRISESFSWGKFLYVDDLVTNSDDRSKSYGDKLFDWLLNHAREHNCNQFHLDSGVQRFATHRFYFRKRMVIGAYHFVIKFQDD